MGSLKHFRLSLSLREGKVTVPSPHLHRVVCAGKSSSPGKWSRSWQKNSAFNSSVDLSYGRNPLATSSLRFLRKLSFDPLARRGLQDGRRQIIPLSVQVDVSEAAAVDVLEEVATDEIQPEEGEIVQEKEQNLSIATLLWRAVKLPIYSVCFIPLTVGAAVAYWQTGVFNGARYRLMLWSSVLIITWLNLSNDAYDAETGVDKLKKESVVNITGSQKGVLWAAFACLVVGLVGLINGASQAGDMRVAALLVLAIACGYVYQCPPFRLSYKGLGEPLCFLAFGPLATTAFYLSQAQASAGAVLPIAAPILGASVLVGITTSLILFCSHFHQIESDTAAGKISPLVKLGTEKGAKVVQATVIGLYTIVASLSVSRSLPVSCPLFVLLTVPIGKLVTDFVQKNHTNKQLIFMAKYFAVRLHVAFGLALTLGFTLASKLPLPA
ncbi:hypothetical protein R1flu_012556 [Riccia fluitans]|uniref:1,4-dihydroxy-2-naphthoate polyprenyltransferase, chloroplastic n=1 Tax=Riccia fluitans TaxID=41844 RepID=A0ABD1ZAY5_9MARC